MTTDLLPSFGKYAGVQRLGEGGFGEVYRAVDTTLDRPVALKVPHRELLRDPGFAAQFGSEAQTAAKLDHPNIVRIYGVGEFEGTPFIEMELVEGQTLADLIKAKGRLTPEEALAIIEPVCVALEEAHRKGIIHRDIKPGNILIRVGDGRVLVTDFGLAKARETSFQASLSSSNVVVGTFRYMPPEQANPKLGEIGPTSDVYSLGVVLYEMLTGRVPFEGKSVGQLIYQHASEEPDPPSNINFRLTWPVESVVLKALQKRPADRFASAPELAHALRAAVEQRQTVLGVAARRRASWSELRWLRSPVGLVAVLGVPLAVLTIVVLSLAARGTLFRPNGRADALTPVTSLAQEPSAVGRATAAPNPTPASAMGTAVPTARRATLTAATIPGPSPTPSARPTDTRTPSPTPRPTNTPPPTPTPRPTETPVPAATGFPTPARPYQVTALGRLEEQEPNGTFSRANIIYFGERVWGTIDPAGEDDFYTFDTPGGTGVTVDINAAVEGSSLDSYLEVYDGFGRRQTANDNDGSTTDSRVVFTSVTGTYYVRVSSAIPNAGGPKHLYELILSPPTVKPPLLPTRAPARGEQEPNDTPSRANSVLIGDTVWGAIGKPGDVDYFCFRTNTTTAVIIDVNAVFESSTLESTLTLWDDLGTRLVGPVRGDGSSTDSRIERNLSQGAYCVELRSADADKGGSSYLYVLQLR